MAALLDKSGIPTPADACNTIISAGSAWNGNLEIEGSVRIEGQFSGELATKDTVHIMRGAKVNATIRAAFVVIAGEFDGQLHCSERLELLETGRGTGELNTKLLAVNEGAFMSGQLRMVNSSH